MDSTPTLSQRSKVDPRRRRRTHIDPLQKQSKEQPRKEKDRPRAPSAKSFWEQKEEERRQSTMTRDHRLYHRRQAGAATQVLTVNVEVIATVDTSGNLVGQETKTQSDPAASTTGTPVQPPQEAVSVAAVNILESVAAPAVPAVPAVSAVSAVSAVIKAVDGLTPSVAQVPPSVPVPVVPSLPQVPSVPAVPTVALPVVPSVPPFPTDLTVPAYPWPSGVSAQAVQVSAASGIPSPAPTSVITSSAISASISAALNSASNSTAISTSSSLSSAFLVSGSVSASASASGSAFLSASTRTSSSTLDETASAGRGSATSPASGTGYVGGAGGGDPVNTAVGAPQNTAAAGSSATGSTPPLQTPKVVGSVVGSLAGAALILAIILLLLRRHKRQRRGALQLTGDETTERAAPMSQDPSRNNRIPSAFLNRFSGMSKSTTETNTSAGERSFQRVSGRKLPSAFSEGMTSDQFSRGGTLSGSSFYQDDQGTYGGPGISKEFAKETGSATAAGTGMMNIRPGPARTPVIRHPDDHSNPFADPAPFPRDTSHLSPPQSPNPDAPRSTLGRSLQSADGSRSSKFTENV